MMESKKMIERWMSNNDFEKLKRSDMVQVFDFYILENNGGEKLDITDYVS